MIYVLDTEESSGKKLTPFYNSRALSQLLICNSVFVFISVNKKTQLEITTVFLIQIHNKKMLKGT